MTMLNLSELANYQGYKHEKRIVCPGRTVVNRNEALKFYALFREGLAPPWEVEKEVRRFLLNEGARHEFELGFAILSEDSLNVARWSSRPSTPHVLSNNLYSVEKLRKRVLIMELDIAAAGAFCAFELAIAGHESNAWRRYLASQRTDDDKRKYLTDMIKGEIC